MSDTKTGAGAGIGMTTQGGPGQGGQRVGSVETTTTGVQNTTVGVAGPGCQGGGHVGQAGQGISTAQPAQGTTLSNQTAQPGQSAGPSVSNAQPAHATSQAAPVVNPSHFATPAQPSAQVVPGNAIFAFGHSGQATAQPVLGTAPFTFAQPVQGAGPVVPGIAAFALGQPGQVAAQTIPAFSFGQAGQGAGTLVHPQPVPNTTGLIGPGLFGFGGLPRGSSWSTFSLPPNRGLFFSLGSHRPATPEPVAISSKLPNEVIQVVINHLGQAKQLSTLASLLCTSRAAYNAVAPTLYDEVVVTRKNARGVFLGLHEGVPLARQAKRVKSITWERFKHPDHDREFENARRRWAAGNRKKRQLHNIWPDFDIDSDDESDPASDTDSGGVPYPNEASFKRKAKLLSVVRCLHFEELPPTRLCFNLAKLTKKRNIPPMPALGKLIMGPKAVWQMLDWEDRHEDADRHPISTYINDLRVKRVCIQLPFIDDDAEKSYMTSRLVTAEEHYSRDNLETQHAYLRKHLKGIVSGSLNRLLRLSGKAGGHSPTHLTVHNLTSHIPDLFRHMVGWSELQACRIFYRPCVCCDGHVMNPVDDKYCYTHFSNPANHRLLNESLPEPGTVAKPNQLTLLELIDLDWQSGRIEEPIRKRALVDSLNTMIAGKEGRQKEYLQKTVAVKSSNEVEACECCGNRQLSGDQSSIGSANQ